MSVHSLSIQLYPCKGHVGDWSHFQLTLAEKWGTLWTGRQRIAGLTHKDKEPLTFIFTFTFIHTGYLSPITQTCMSLDLEKTHTSTGRTCKIHTDSSRTITWNTSRIWCISTPRLLQNEVKKCSSVIKIMSWHTVYRYNLGKKTKVVLHQILYIYFFFKFSAVSNFAF